MATILMILFWIAVGIVIGWNLEQPDWAKQAQQQAVDLFNKMIGKAKD